MKRLLFFALLALVGWFWWSSMWAREIARQAAKRQCEKHGVQLIDDTVERTRMRTGRDENGQMCLIRHYRFQFTTTRGEQRFEGEVITRGRVVADIKMQPWPVE